MMIEVAGKKELDRDCPPLIRSNKKLSFIYDTTFDGRN